MDSKTVVFPSQMAQLLQTPEWQQLIRAFKNADPEALQRATAALQAGNSALAVSILAPYMGQEALSQLLRNLQEGKSNG